MPGSAALRLTKVEDLIAGTARFQTKTGAANATAAKQRVFYGEQGVAAALEAGATLSSLRPAVILCLDRHGYVQIGEGSRILLGGTGGIVAIFVDNPEQPDNHKQSLLAFVDWVSEVIDQLSAESGRDAAWPVNSIELIFEPYRPNIADRKSDDFWLAAYLLADHINGGA
jgi:hypothetical protein